MTAGISETTADAVMATSGKTFYQAARLLPSDVRAGVISLYSFCRTVDDLADECTSSVEHRRGLLWAVESGVRGNADPHAATACGWNGALAQSSEVVREAAALLVAAVRDDLAQRQPADSAALLRYAFGVAGTVGLMLAEMLGARPAGRAAAVQLGLAMQLTNIARDVAQDCGNGRVYLPVEWIPGKTLSSALSQGDAAAEEQLQRATLRLLRLAETFYEGAYDGMWTLPWRVRWSILAAAMCYREIGLRVADDIPGSWLRRTVVSRPRKIWLIALAGLRLFRPRFWRHARTRRPAAQLAPLYQQLSRFELAS